MNRQYAQIIVTDNTINWIVNQIFDHYHGRVPLEEFRRLYKERFQMGIPVESEQVVNLLPWTPNGRVLYYHIDNGIVLREGFLQKG